MSIPRVEASVQLAAGNASVKVSRIVEVPTGTIELNNNDTMRFGSAPLTREEARLLVNVLRYVYDLS